jgi:transcriptional regulator with XRE-family HTH domain
MSEKLCPRPRDALQGFGERLARVVARERGRGKKQSFARKIGVSPAQLSRYLKGQIPDPPVLVAIAEAGQVSLDWLLMGREPWSERATHLLSSEQLLQRLAQLPSPMVAMLLAVLNQLEAMGVLNQWL